MKKVISVAMAAAMAVSLAACGQGGGSQDNYLNQMTANATGLPVFAGPTEGTALGNLLVQFIAAGAYSDLQAARDAIKASFDIKEICPA